MTVGQAENADRKQNERGRLGDPHAVAACTASPTAATEKIVGDRQALPFGEGMEGRQAIRKGAAVGERPVDGTFAIAEYTCPRKEDPVGGGEDERTAAARAGGR